MNLFLNLEHDQKRSHPDLQPKLVEQMHILFEIEEISTNIDIIEHIISNVKSSVANENF